MWCPRALILPRFFPPRSQAPAWDRMLAKLLLRTHHRSRSFWRGVPEPELGNELEMWYPRALILPRFPLGPKLRLGTARSRSSCFARITEAGASGEAFPSRSSDTSWKCDGREL